MPKLYVGTYAKYNAGSIAGAWLDLDDYTGAEDFHFACLELHKDETDPELMFQDYEGLPACLYSESGIDSRLWAWLELDEDDRDMCSAYWSEEDPSAGIDYIREAYCGTADTETDYAQQLAEDIGAINENATWPNNCIDWDQAVRELKFDYSFVRYEGTLYVFRPH